MDMHSGWPGRGALASGLLALVCGCAGAAQPEGDGAGGGVNEVEGVREGPALSGVVRLTSDEMFVKAGEQYFSPDGRWIVFQGVARPAAGETAPAHYAMYVARVTRDAEGWITGLERVECISPAGSANTCGWFHPRRPWEVMFGSTLRAPGEESGPGYQRPGGRYAWQFPREMEVCSRIVEGVFEDAGPEAPREPWTEGATTARAMFERDGYDAECSYSRDGRHVLYAHVDEEESRVLGRPDADLYVFDTRRGEHVALVTAEGYDGGAFFSPDESWICYRSDRKGDGKLQLFAGELAYGEDGAITGLKREVKLTDNDVVNWAPYFHPSGRFLVYTTSELGHDNYEVFALEFSPDTPMERLWRTRVTFAEGFDGLASFSADGRWMIWCGQRDGEGRASSQVWAARFDAEALIETGRGAGGGSN